MALVPHSESERLARAVERLLPEARAWSGVIYRSSSPAYATSRDLLSGAGALRHGGRWNSPGKCAAVYGSLSPEIAMAEALEHYRYYRLDPWQMGRRVFCPLRVEASAVLDLTKGILRRRLRVSIDRMRAEDWRVSMAAGRQALTQAIGDAAFKAGLEGLMVPSKPVPEGANLLLFPENLRSRSHIRELRPRR